MQFPLPVSLHQDPKSWESASDQPCSDSERKGPFLCFLLNSENTVPFIKLFRTRKTRQDFFFFSLSGTGSCSGFSPLSCCFE